MNLQELCETGDSKVFIKDVYVDPNQIPGYIVGDQNLSSDQVSAQKSLGCILLQQHIVIWSLLVTYSFVWVCFLKFFIVIMPFFFVNGLLK